MKKNYLAIATLTLACTYTGPTHPSIIKGLYNLAFTHNFHTIQKGMAYRSGSMPAHRMARKIISKNIKSVINLRAGEAGNRWQPHQAAVAHRLKKLGRTITFYNIPSSARTLPSRATVMALLDAFKCAPRPVLIHCRSGADRTSEAAALWQITQQHLPKAQALRQLSTRFGHFSSRFPRKRQFITMLPDDSKKVAHWLRTKYRPDPVFPAHRACNAR